MKTAIDWLIDQYVKDDGKLMSGVYEQAKEMEKRQHETTFHRGINIGALNPELDIEGRKESAKHYYESTFVHLNNQNKQHMKIYTEEQVRKVIWEFGDLLFNNCQDGIKEDDLDSYTDIAIQEVTPIELPSDDEAGVIALKIADTLKDKLTTEQEAYFIAGFQTCAKWVKE